MQSSQHAFTMLHCAMVFLVAGVMASCGSAAPSDLLIPHSSTGDSDSGVGDGTNEAGVPDATTVVPIVEAGPPDVSAQREASLCGSDSCPNGCCDNSGRCLLGTDDTACGTGGVACGSCTDLGEMCNEGMCTMSMNGQMDAGCDPMACPADKCFFGSMPCCNLTGACSCTRFNLCP